MNLIGPLKSGIITDKENYIDTLRDTELEANLSLLFILKDQPFSLPEHEQQEVEEEEEV